MIETTPPLPQGNSGFHNWARWVQRSILAFRSVTVPGAFVQRTTRGIRIIPRGGVSDGEKWKRFLVKEVKGDYLVCSAWDGVTAGEEDVLIAKEPELRHSLTSQTIQGVEVTYTDHAIAADGCCTRTATASGYEDQEEMVIPTWQIGGGVDSEIWACEPDGGTGVEVDDVELKWLLPSSSRAWCQIG